MIYFAALIACSDPVDLSEKETDPPDYLILSPDYLQDAALRLSEHRSSEGKTVQIILRSQLPSDVEEMHASISKVVESMPLEPISYLTILGDVPENGSDNLFPVTDCDNLLGGCYTDNRYGDVDGDRIPEVSVGRIPAQNIFQANAYLDKLIDHETAVNPGPWNRRLSLYAGYSGFGEFIEEQLERMILRGLAAVDPAVEIIGLYNNPQSPFFYTPFEDKVIDILNEGSVITMYIGHGEAAESEGLDLETLESVSCENRRPMMSFFACNNGQFAEATDSVAERALFKSDGPIGVFAATDVTHPYINGIGPYELQRAVFDMKAQTMGEAIFLSRRAWFSNEDDPIRSEINVYLSLFELDEDQAEQTLLEHLDLYNFLGDPATKLKLPPHRMDMTVLSGSRTEGSLVVSGSIEGMDDGFVSVSLNVPRDEMHAELAHVDSSSPDPATVQSNWAAAVNTAIATMEADVINGSFSVTFEFEPWPVTETLYIKGFAFNENEDAYGYIEAP